MHKRRLGVTGPDPAVAALRLAVRRGLQAAGVQAAGLQAAGVQAAGVQTAPAGPVVVACSGGADSLALAAAAVFECRRLGRAVVGATVDHGLQEGSAERADAVVAALAGLGVDETLTARVDVRASGQGPEAAAREARYAVLEEVAQRVGSRVVLLGHTLDDQAETVLLGLARGSGGRSIAGMRRAFPPFLRPLLDVTRAQTEQACRAEGLSFWEDPHNEDPRFTRSRVRHRVLPVLEAELGPGVTAALARTADLLQQDMEALDDLADQAHAAAATEGGALDTRQLVTQPLAVSSRVLRRAAVAAGCPSSELFRVHVQALVDLTVGAAGRQVQMPGQVTAYRDRRLLRFAPTSGVAG